MRGRDHTARLQQFTDISMLYFFKNLTIGQLESARLVLEVLFVLSGIGVAIGVALEKERFDIGWKVLVAALGIEIVFTVLIFNCDSEVSRRQEYELAETYQKTEELRADNLALQQAMRPRHISFNEYTLASAAVADAFERLKALRGTVALIQPVPDFEARLFAQDIENTLNYLGWNARIVDAGVTHLSDLSFVDGITIFTFPNASRPASNSNGAEVQAAMRALVQEDGEDDIDVAPIALVANGQKGYPYLDPPIPGAVLIRVGVRQFSPAFLAIQKRTLGGDWTKGSRPSASGKANGANGPPGGKEPVFLQPIPAAPAEQQDQ